MNLFKIIEGKTKLYSIENSIKQVFTSYFDIIEKFTKTLTSKKFKEYYKNLVEIVYGLTQDEPEILPDQLSVFD